ncbi:hypothetical protein RFJ04_004400 [Klebsiella variicola]|uniref:hypothetical protein n=1 Tax=Enterobacterales TaxID=91347 RepID=UPI0027F01676|nr:hypothetical protein [Klebsiella michiganensis]EJH2158574.1 hypothetical protein [Salmonella enterica]EKC5142241.1 hypothetical protein [Salmonella enterica]ELA2926336.1 hypothetical protein [Klebsiella variicola]MDV0373977.1 hypothetical protein [Klebsiella michiganensis]
MKKFNLFNRKVRGAPAEVVPIRPGVLSASNDDISDGRAAKAKWVAIAAIKGVGNVLCSLIFIVMLWLRLPVKLLLVGVSVMAFIGVFLCLTIFSDRSMVTGFILMGLTTTALAWAYDVLLTRLTP